MERWRGGLIVSCQALEDEPLFGSSHMAVMAAAAEQGGAVAIRANSPADVAAIKLSCSLPVMGIYKQVYPNSDVFITPTLREAEQLAAAGADWLALDATGRPRPDGQTLEQLVRDIRRQFPHLGLMADISNAEEGIRAMDLGFDLVSTTLAGYTADSVYTSGPDLELIRSLAALSRTPVVAEGRVWTPDDCRSCLEAGAYAVVVGTAITRPREITARFVEGMRNVH